MTHREFSDGFERRLLAGAGADIDVLIGGEGPPLLLLHGYPQTRMIWRAMRDALARRYTLVMPDLRGYGRSSAPPDDSAHTTYAKSTMADDQVAVMTALGFDRYAVAGHDRGARVAYRMALNHPHRVTRLAVLDVLPTWEMWEAANAKTAMGSFHWYLLAQPAPFPETLINGAPEHFVRHCLAAWAAPGFAFDETNMADYVTAFQNPAVVHATCADYRAGWSTDRDEDAADRAAGRRITVPTLVLWGEESGFARNDPLTVWSRWAADVRGSGVPGAGHFLPEESPETTAARLTEFLEES